MILSFVVRIEEGERELPRAQSGRVKLRRERDGRNPGVFVAVAGRV